MSTYDDLDELTGEFESLVSSLQQPTTLNKFREANIKLNQVAEAEQTYLKSKQDANDKLQKELDELNKQMKELEERLKQKKDNLMELEQQREKERLNVENLGKEYAELVEEVQALEQDNSLAGADDTTTKIEENPVQLQLALYRGLGITLKLDNSERVTEASLTSLDGQDIRIIPLNEKSIVSTANRIWSFIS